MTTVATPGLVSLGGIHDLAAQTHAGMAHFAGTGPAGKACADCAFFSAKRMNKFEGYCKKYSLLMRRKTKGDDFPASSAACKYFEPPPAKPRVVPTPYRQTKFW